MLAKYTLHYNVPLSSQNIFMNVRAMIFHHGLIQIKITDEELLKVMPILTSFAATSP